MSDRSPTDSQEEMIRRQIIGRGVRSEAVLNAMSRVPRALFVLPGSDPYADAPAPIPEGQTVSQPYIVARMTELLELQPGMTVLEIGAGIGYQTAILAAMGAEVYAIERHATLVDMARQRLDALGVDLRIVCGDGVQGWPEPMRFDRILAAATAAREPTELFMRQLADGGRAVLPVESADGEHLLVVDRHGDSLRRQTLDAVRFVPLVTDAL